MKPILYVDLDNTLVDFQKGIDRTPDAIAREHLNGKKGVIDYDEVPGIFSLMDPMPGAIDAIRKLQEHFDIFILSTAPWKNPSAWSDKLKWVQRYFADLPGVDEDNKNNQQFYKRLILTHHKDLLFSGNEFLIDDRPNNGSKNFAEHWIKFGPEGENAINELSDDEKAKCWDDAVAELKRRAKVD